MFLLLPLATSGLDCFQSPGRPLTPVLYHARRGKPRATAKTEIHRHSTRPEPVTGEALCAPRTSANETKLLNDFLKHARIKYCQNKELFDVNGV